MAWSEQAWRHSLAGITDPSQADTEQQWRLALAGVANASDLYEFTPEAWDYDESLTLTITPLPDTGFDVTTRYALANVAAVGLSDSVNRDGDVLSTLSTFAVDFDGTVTVPTFDGDVVASLSAFTSGLSGTFLYRHYFDVSWDITPTWVVYSQPARFGDLVATVGAFSVDLDGYALPPDSTQGRVAFAVSGFTSDLDGAYTAPPTFDGDLLADIQSYSVSFAGSSVPADSALGLIDASVDSFVVDATGTFAVWNTDGDIALSPGEFSVSYTGAFIDASAANGLFSGAIADFTVAIVGSGSLGASATAKPAEFISGRRTRYFYSSARSRTFKVN